ncbi:hypothetical protein OsI_26944 [Oryza sativa Indica Group]|uniref:Uncharacterized protein n=6 Tax=Oryza TaxID=4527 RepID=Q8LI37_ORYSJ|nr:hypothetical protein OsI_26944 [Oryza sativa Indica Group]EAZ40731.1 hypothetical protein OsJ_25199 [Oryza sativa Japonica Group]BAC07069.1 hypothetical protein [Oryza sativa Japonica Group]
MAAWGSFHQGNDAIGLTPGELNRFNSSFLSSDTISISQSYAIRLAIYLQRIQQRGRMNAEEKSSFRTCSWMRRMASITDADDDGCLAIHFVSLRRTRDTFRTACLAIKS